MLKENTWYKIKPKDKLCYSFECSYDDIYYKGLNMIEEMFRLNKVFCKKIYYWENDLPTFNYNGYIWQEWMLEPIYPLIMETE